MSRPSAQGEASGERRAVSGRSAALSAEQVLADIQERLVYSDGGCWLWQGSYVNGAPDLRLGARHIRVRRWLYQHHGGQITSGQAALPLCTRQACVAPQHTIVRGRGRGLGPGAPAQYAGPRIAARR